MFSYAKLLRLKKRDFEFWTWKAQKALIEKEMRSANTMRVAMTSQEKYRQWFEERRSMLLRLDGKLEDLQKENWEALWAKGRG